jgi:hypothetical protein
VDPSCVGEMPYACEGFEVFLAMPALSSPRRVQWMRIAVRVLGGGDALAGLGEGW